jgi:ribonuclease HII
MAAVKLTLGIDEAGRGPAIGPMVMSAVALDSKAASALTKAGLRDSKTYGAGDDAHEIRRELAARIRERATFVTVRVLLHDEIDRRVVRNELNVLEREVATTMIDEALAAMPKNRCGRIIADGKRMFAPLAARYDGFESHDRGEDRHASVAAASVIAKAMRDELYAQIRGRYEPEFGAIAGGGYANAGTQRFVEAYAKRYKRLPDEFRRTWPCPYVSHIVGDVRPPAPQASLF